LNENVLTNCSFKVLGDIIAGGLMKIYVRKQLRRLYEKCITTKVVKTKKMTKQHKKFNQYFDWSEPLTKAFAPFNGDVACRK
jgi:uncharacterized protein